MRQDTKDSIDRYARERCPTGDFLRAVLENDLMEAVGRADEGNLLCLHEICSYVYNHIPADCHGSREIVKVWLKGECNDSKRCDEDDRGRSRVSES